MQVPRYKPSRKFGFSMTPMIDVVFLLIIFFLVSSHLQRQETQQELDLPVAQASIEDEAKPTPRVTINVLEDGSMVVSGRGLNAGRLEPMLRSVRDEKGKDLEIRIRSSKTVPWSKVEPIMLACTKVGLWDVGFATYEREW